MLMTFRNLQVYVVSIDIDCLEHSRKYKQSTMRFFVSRSKYLQCRIKSSVLYPYHIGVYKCVMSLEVFSFLFYQKSKVPFVAHWKDKDIVMGSVARVIQTGIGRVVELKAAHKDQIVSKQS